MNLGFEYQAMIENKLEHGLHQPACGCRVEWYWRWCHQALPDSVHVMQIKPCEKHRGKGEIVEAFGDLYQGFLEARLKGRR